MTDKKDGWGEKWPAPAKLNLMLRITGQRDDGYHLLQTVFQLTDLCDWITFHQVGDGRISLLDPIPGVPEETDLTVRAAKILQQETGCGLGVQIEVEKNLPMGGGLGGGSSDAATTLLVLNRLWDLNLSEQRLMELGLQLGADVPVFVYGYAAWAEGVGEKLQKIDTPEKWVVVIKPDCHVDTKEIFSVKDLTRDSKSITMPDFVEGQHQNDCLEVVRKLYQPVEKALVDLAEFSEARLTGTGACVFAQFESKELAEKAYAALKDRWQVYLLQGLNKSLLKDRLK
ncbi:MAG: 4-(cytidine 5'-diphospho)-2-C-methyl-D-erythritol kinase [Gammaproteobacteria bacterium]|nr:MAG: 4-(cytidine 5'-diphospho)-2-C-methyl-D-erythritol kinase [Gammaproteobacteria bacterium]